MTPTPRTPRAQATRERLLHAAVRVFTERGYDHATMDDVAAAAGVSRRTAFNHFASKGDLAVAWAAGRAETAFALARPSAAADPFDAITTVFHELAAATEAGWEETRQLTTAWIRGYGAPDHRSPLSAELREWLRGPLSGGSLDPALAADVLFDVFQGALLRRLDRADPPPAGAFTTEVDALVAVVVAGLTGAGTGTGKAGHRGSPRTRAHS
ncbi:TetR/AcrR family transcriptional regulator [Amycolatopsis rhabdoformis]|uniref:TetR/AcrR family transcriptional regulator n=1 Tax=Amycolatopsis rhabdoformis TaxID=1448059 RepID=A0ABZ1IJW2_9PSEU|nr:TetR/AcrR family transcriptional regulator [Amycolatopsis rhabdoformis]WSE34513.1 TetR/AcrR family transcriptional regulator [Amycolatopsis rhabdoformis]